MIDQAYEDVSRQQGRSVDDKGEMTTRGVFQKWVYERVKDLWNSKDSEMEKWAAPYMNQHSQCREHLVVE